MSIQSYLLDNIQKDLDVAEKELAANNLQLADLDAVNKALKSKIKELLAVKKALATIKE